MSAEDRRRCFREIPTDYRFLQGLSSDEVHQWHAEFFRDNPSGRLDHASFRRLFRILRNESPERLNDISDHVFRAFDVDGNGWIEFGEFLLGFAICSHGDLRARLDYAFECYDIDSNGFLTEGRTRQPTDDSILLFRSADEIAVVLRSMYSLLGITHIEDYPPPDVAKDVMKKLDVSNDGRVSKDEFIRYLMKDGICRITMNPFH